MVSAKDLPGEGWLPISTATRTAQSEPHLPVTRFLAVQVRVDPDQLMVRRTNENRPQG